MSKRVHTLSASLLSAILLMTASVAEATGDADGDRADRARQIVEDAYGGDGAGAAVMAMEAGELIVTGAAGFADLEWGVAVTPATSFRIGSITKPITAVAVLQLVEAGRVELDAPIGTYLPDLSGVLGQPTVRQLLSHTSGLPDHFSLPQIPEIMRNPTTPHEITAMMAEAELMFDPGTAWSYSNFNYVLLGRLIEALDAEGREYGTFVEEELFHPLGMESSHYDRQAAVVPRRARGYDHDGTKPINTITVETSLAHAAGALMSSAEDLATFTDALRSGALLGEAMRDTAWTAVTLPDGSSTEYGLGFNVSRFMGETAIWHSGSINGFQASWIHLPSSDRAVAVLSNGFYRPNTTTVARRILAELAGEPVPRFEPVPIDTAAWNDLEGRYHLADDRILQIHVQDGVRFDVDGGGWTELAYAGEDVFYRPDSLSHVRLHRDDAGTITGLSWVTSALERLDGGSIPGPIEGALHAIPLDVDEATRVTGRWLMSSGDAIVVALDEDTLTLQLPGQPSQRIHPSAPRHYFSRDNPISIVFDEEGRTAEVRLWGQGLDLTRD